MVLLKPSKLFDANIDLIWTHWTQRQNSNSQALVFLKAKPGHMRQARQAHQACQAMPQHQKKDGKVDFFGDDDNGEGPSQVAHSDSPATHATSLASKMAFLLSLSSEKVYTDFVDLLMSSEDVEDVSILFGNIWTASDHRIQQEGSTDAANLP